MKKNLTKRTNTKKKTPPKVASKVSPRGQKAVAKGGAQASAQAASDEVQNAVNQGEVFSEEALLAQYRGDVSVFEQEYLRHRRADDFTDEEAGLYLRHLDTLLDDPDEIWEDRTTLAGKVVHHFIRFFSHHEPEFAYVASCHTAEDQDPTFILMHFPTRDEELVEQYRRGEIVFERAPEGVEKGAIEGDSLGEGDELSIGLYQAMLTLRSDQDIPEDSFEQYADLREITIEDPDEIWRSTDLSGQILVNFIKEFEEAEGEDSLYYVVVTLEEEASNSHALLFSFPSDDSQLIDRYRHGENLQAEEVVQEASH